MMLGPHLFGLLNVSQADLEPVAVAAVVAVQPSCFLSVIWHREAFHGLGIQSVKVLILVGALFLPSVTPESQQGFGVTELTLSGSVS
jgi:hypothetical protein